MKKSRGSKLADAAEELISSGSESLFDATRFFEKFELLADTPNTVKRLREIVLNMATRGLIVRSSLNPREAVSPEEIRNRRVSLVKSGLIKKNKPWVDFAGLDELRHPLPSTWCWIRLGEIADVVRGGSPRPAGDPRFYGGRIPFLKVADVTRSPTRYVNEYSHTIKDAGLKKTRLIDQRTVLLTNSGATLGVPGICTITTTFNDGIAAFNYLDDAVFDEYLYVYLLKQSPWFMNVASRGQGQPNLNTDIIRSTWLPLPPLAEQKRIVAKVDELMGLCDRLQALEAERKDRHASLSRAALARFAASPTPTNLQLLFHKSYDIAPAELRKSILTLAVQGKLVPQDPNDEPAEVISGKNEELKGRAQFEIPDQWTWANLNQLAEINGGFAFKSTDYTESGMRVIRISDFDEFGFKDHKVVRHPFSPDLQKFLLAEDNILMAMTGGTVGKSYFVRSLPEPMVVNQRVATIKVSEYAHSRYVDIAIRSEMTQEVIRNAKNSTNDNISMEDIKSFAVPMPPLAEQLRIVAKVEQLMALVDQLEQQLAHSRTLGQQVLEAVVANLTAN